MKITINTVSAGCLCELIQHRLVDLPAQPAQFLQSAIIRQTRHLKVSNRVRIASHRSTRYQSLSSEIARPSPSTPISENSKPWEAVVEKVFSLPFEAPFCCSSVWLTHALMQGVKRSL